MPDIPAKSDLTYFHSARLLFLSCSLDFANFTMQCMTFQCFNCSFIPFNVIFIINPYAFCNSLCSLWFTINQAGKPIQEPGNVWRLEFALRPYGEPIWARNPLDSQLHLVLLIRNRTTFKYLIGFRSIITSCQMPRSILFTIHLFFNAWCLIIWLSEHRIFFIQARP